MRYALIVVDIAKYVSQSYRFSSNTEAGTVSISEQALLKKVQRSS